MILTQWRWDQFAAVSESETMSKASIPTLSEHYKRLAAEYDDHYRYHRDYSVKFLMRHVTFDPNDHIIDVGGGTGEIDHLIWKQAGLKNPILCLDPSEDMIQRAQGKEGVTALCSSAEKFFSTSPPERVFDKILITFCIHHFERNIAAVFSDVKDHLSDTGVCIVLHYVEDMTLPFFQALGRTLPSFNLEKICATALDGLELKWERITGTERCVVEKGRWYAALRARYGTYLEPFTDEELEEGIAGLERKYKGQEEVELDFDLQMIVFRKKINDSNEQCT